MIVECEYGIPLEVDSKCGLLAEWGKILVLDGTEYNAPPCECVQDCKPDSNQLLSFDLHDETHSYTFSSPHYAHMPNKFHRACFLHVDFNGI